MQLPQSLHFDPVVPHRALYFLVVVKLCDFCVVQALVAPEVLGDEELVDCEVLG
jgi:hypothetical protein